MVLLVRASLVRYVSHLRARDEGSTGTLWKHAQNEIAGSRLIPSETAGTVLRSLFMGVTVRQDLLILPRCFSSSLFWICHHCGRLPRWNATADFYIKSTVCVYLHVPLGMSQWWWKMEDVHVAERVAVKSWKLEGGKGRSGHCFHLELLLEPKWNCSCPSTTIVLIVKWHFNFFLL